MRPDGIPSTATSPRPIVATTNTSSHASARLFAQAMSTGVSAICPTPLLTDRYESLLRVVETLDIATAFDVQAAPAALIATASINCDMRFVALLFSCRTSRRVVARLSKLGREGARQPCVTQEQSATHDESNVGRWGCGAQGCVLSNSSKDR